MRAESVQGERSSHGWSIGLALTGIVLLIAIPSFAGENRAPAELAARPFTFSKPALPLEQALSELTTRTGNAVADTRTRKSSPMVRLPMGPTTFWPALDALADAGGIGYTAYTDAGGVALVDGPYRPATV